MFALSRRILQHTQHNGTRCMSVIDQTHVPKVVPTSVPPKVGHICELNRTFTLEDGKSFTSLTGYANPIHQPLDSSVDQSINPFGQPIVHGMLAASLFSTLFASHFNGAIYLNQSLNFMKPVFYNQPVNARITVLKCQHTRRGAVVECDTRITRVEEGQEIELVTGHAKVMMKP